MEEAKDRLMAVIKHLRFAASCAAEGDNRVQLGILSVKPDGAGRVVCQMDVKEFIEDIATVIGAGPQTQEDIEEAKAEQLLSRLGLR